MLTNGAKIAENLISYEFLTTASALLCTGVFIPGNLSIISALSTIIITSYSFLSPFCLFGWVASADTDHSTAPHSRFISKCKTTGKGDMSVLSNSSQAIFKLLNFLGAWLSCSSISQILANYFYFSGSAGPCWHWHLSKPVFQFPPPSHRTIPHLWPTVQ